MPSNYWIKLYHEILHDPKMGRLPDHLWRRCIEFFLLAGENNTNGMLPAMENMTWILRADEETLTAELRALCEIGIVHCEEGAWIVTHFAKRQAKVPAVERKRQQRARDRHADYDSHATVTSRDSVVTDTVTSRTIDADADVDLDADIDADADVAAAAATPSEESFEQLVGEHGIALDSPTRRAAWYSLLGISRDLSLFREAFQEATISEVRPSPRWMRAVLERCVREGCRPGERAPRDGPDPPAPISQLRRPPRTLDPFTGQIAEPDMDNNGHNQQRTDTATTQ